jgi:ATP-dependent DNA ligase
VIIGYNLDESQHITALHLATTRGDGKLVYVGSVKKGISEEASKELLQRLKKNVSQQPLIKVSGTSATWVAPKVYCEVHQDGYDDANHLKSPALANVLAD